MGGNLAHCSVCRMAAHSIRQCLYSKSKQPSQHRVWRGQILTDTVSVLGQPLPRALQVCQNQQLRFLDAGRAWRTSTTTLTSYTTLPSKIWRRGGLTNIHCISSSLLTGLGATVYSCLSVRVLNWLIKCWGVGGLTNLVIWYIYTIIVHRLNRSSVTTSCRLQDLSRGVLYDGRFGRVSNADY